MRTVYERLVRVNGRNGKVALCAVLLAGPPVEATLPSHPHPPVEPKAAPSNIKLTTGDFSTSWPGPARPSTSLPTAPKTWMAATGAAMTSCDSRPMTRGDSRPVLPQVFDRSSTGQPWDAPGHDVEKHQSPIAKLTGQPWTKAGG